MAARHEDRSDAFYLFHPRSLLVHSTTGSRPRLRTIGVIAAVASVMVIAFATLRPEAAPTVTVNFCLICGSRGGVDAILNFFLFLPLGAGLALTAARPSRALFAVVVLSALIELAQFVAISGRDASFGDLLTNSIGGTTGFAIGRYAGT